MGFEHSGRRPKPTAVHILNGNPSRKKLNDLEPKPPEGEVRCPKGLSGGAKVVWDELAPICITMGTLTIADIAAFRKLCELEDTARRASAQKDAEGFGMFTISQDYNGADKVGVHAAIRIERETAGALRPYYEYFGLTAVGRARLSVPKKAEEPVSKWAGALK